MVCYGTKRINTAPTSVNSFTPTAWECYSGVEISYGMVMPAFFEDYCQTDTNCGDNSMKPMARGVIALYEAGDHDAICACFI